MSCSSKYQPATRSVSPRLTLLMGRPTVAKSKLKTKNHKTRRHLRPRSPPLCRKRSHLKNSNLWS